MEKLRDLTNYRPTYKYATDNFKKRLLKFYNKILTEGKIPADFKKAIVVSYKKGDRNNPSNHRGITLLVADYKYSQR